MDVLWFAALTRRIPFVHAEAELRLIEATSYPHILDNRIRSQILSNLNGDVKRFEVIMPSKEVEAENGWESLRTLMGAKS